MSVTSFLKKEKDMKDCCLCYCIRNYLYRSHF